MTYPGQTRHKHRPATSQTALTLMNSKFYGHLVYLLVRNLVTYPEEKHLGTKIHLRKHTQHAKARNSGKSSTHSKTSEQGYATSTPPRTQGQLVTYNLWLSPTDVDSEQQSKTCKNMLHASNSRDTQLCSNREVGLFQMTTINVQLRANIIPHMKSTAMSYKIVFQT